MSRILSISIVIAFGVCVSIIPCLADNCLLNKENYKCRLSSMTPYRFVANYNDEPVEYPGCTPRKIWLLLRHGTRYPGNKQAPEMIKKLPVLQEIILNNYYSNKTNLTAGIADSLQKWNLTFDLRDTMKLAEEGEDEMIDLGERYQARFPAVMPEIYSNYTYKFKYTDTQRTKESARHFTAGLFGWQASQHISYPTPEHADPILRFYKRCPRWKIEVQKNPQADKEKTMFVNGPIMTETVREISERIGHKVDYETASLLHATCGFETAWNKDVESPWCKLFTLKNLKVLEFAKDLEYYWIDGYGYNITYEQACPAIKDMFDFLTSTNGRRVTAYFTHSGTILKLLAFLGVAQDDRPLTHDQFPTRAEHRAWRTGVIDSFASNIAFVLYDCASQGPSILFMHQERPVYLSGCPENVPCPLSTMKAFHGQNIEDCQFDAICRIRKRKFE